MITLSNLCGNPSKRQVKRRHHHRCHDPDKGVKQRQKCQLFNQMWEVQRSQRSLPTNRKNQEWEVRLLWGNQIACPRYPGQAVKRGSCALQVNQNKEAKQVGSPPSNPRWEVKRKRWNRRRRRKSPDIFTIFMRTSLHRRSSHRRVIN